MNYFMLKHIDTSGKLWGVCLVMTSDERLEGRVYGKHEVVDVTGFITHTSDCGVLNDDGFFRMCYGEQMTDMVKTLLSIRISSWSRTNKTTRHSRWEATADQYYRG